MQEVEHEESVVMEESEIDRTLVRMAHQILEQNKGCQDLAIVGIVMFLLEGLLRLLKKSRELSSL